MTHYNHYNTAISDDFENFITYDQSIIDHGLTYDEYRELSEVLATKGYAIEWIVPEDTYRGLIDEAWQTRAKTWEDLLNP